MIWIPTWSSTLPPFRNIARNENPVCLSDDMVFDSVTVSDFESSNASELPNVRQLYHNTVPIFNYDRGTPTLVATGILVSVEQHRFIVTAAHVFEPVFEKVGFGFLGAAGFEVFGAHLNSMRIFSARDQTSGGDPQRAIYKDDLDLAISEPPQQVIEALEAHYRFYDLRQSSSLADRQWGVVSGWPARKNVYDSKKSVCEFDTCYHIQSPLVPTEKLRAAGWNPDICIGLSVNRKKDFVSATSGEHINLPKLEGLSGAGFWIQSNENVTPETCPHWLLAGIVVEAHDAKRLLKVIKVEHVWTPLFRGWGLVP